MYSNLYVTTAGDIPVQLALQHPRFFQQCRLQQCLSIHCGRLADLCNLTIRHLIDDKDSAKFQAAS